MNLTSFLIYMLPLAIVLVLYMRSHRRKEGHYTAQLETAREAGLTEPASLHPVIDPVKCLGSAACVSACPEGALGIIKGKGHLINPTVCIGHGACKAACPHDAITLVFGTEKRGVDIPQVNPDFQTNVPGIYIAGELGGMGLIRKAVEQGKQAIDSIRRNKASGKQLDVVIVGAGPAGIAAALAALEHKLRFVLLEQEDSFGGTIYHYPRNKVVMTAPMQLPLAGKVNMGEISKELLLEFWQGVLKKTGLRINLRERMEAITPQGTGFVVKTSRATYEARNVLLSIGRRGTPRKLGVPGEEQPKVVYRLIDPEQYRNQHVLVVGGGDSALEAALAVADEPGTTVTLSYRSEAFGRVKEKNRQRLQAAEASGRMRVMLKSNVKNLSSQGVSIEQDGKLHEMKNDAVIVCAGGILPTPFLKEIGILVETKFGTA
jgi:thioredoxin reductase/ferredoxin